MVNRLISDIVESPIAGVLRRKKTATTSRYGIAYQPWRPKVTSLSPSTIKELECRLIRMRTSILEKIREHLHGSGDNGELALANHREEVDDRAVADALNDADIAVLSHELTELRAIHAALLRMQYGTYGVCTDCDDAIPAERLYAQPAAQYCLGCQERLERHHGIAHTPLP